MKTICLIIFIIISNFIFSQNYILTYNIETTQTIPSGQAIIYGNFIQRLGFSSGGFPQDIRIINNETKEIFSLRLKKTFKSSKQNIFCMALKPGNYTIINYWWTKSTWYGGIMHTENIYKDFNGIKNTNKEMDNNKNERFNFTITPNSLNYVGTWNFDSESIKFINDKEITDITVFKKFKNLKIQNSISNLPH
jgi:hypothetical protein